MNPDRYGLIELSHGPILENLLTRYKAGTVLDIGCGNADKCLENKARLVNRLIGLDNRLLIQKELSLMDIPGFYFVRGDARLLPFPDESIDMILMVEMYRACYDLKEVSRVLKPRGTVFVSNSMKGAPIEKTAEQFREYFNIKPKRIYEGRGRYLMVCRKPKPEGKGLGNIIQRLLELNFRKG